MLLAAQVSYQGVVVVTRKKDTSTPPDKPAAETQQTVAASFPIVGLGASAGGLEARACQMMRFVPHHILPPCIFGSGLSGSGSK